MRLALFVAATAICASASACAPSLRVFAVEPNPAVPGGDIDVEGAGFVDGMRMTLVGDVEIALQSIEVSSGSSATASIPEAAPAGEYELVVDVGGAVARFPDVEVAVGGARIHFLDVGQGDATLVVAPTGESLLIDGGPFDAGPVIADAIARLAGGRLDAIVLSHTDADHLAGVVDVLAGDDGVAGSADDVVPLTRISYVDDGSCDSQLCGRARNLSAWPFTIPTVGDRFALGELDIEIVASDGDVGDGKIASTEGDNERSVVVMVRFAGRSVLVTGDLTGGGAGDADVEGPLSRKTGPVDVLRVSHHGSNTSSNAAALAAWAPRAMVLSLGTDNAFCHPADDALDRLIATGAPMFVTGAGVVDDVDRCGEQTPWPGNASTGLGTITLDIGIDGSLVMNGDAL